ncbi:site-specific integrase [Paraburkholderia phenoliruptrix]|uniref:Uncharacterized protein n=2 Tax=Paraburkholderia phenoliruptrix TaxID=252970 RepID=K0DNR1_9BURK|nr:hypothetical protein [Paraburkholderia phenoliruptrix]AFT87811.1 hypothetical protein BUPH_00341 [Paraburkholderia phenoliruptrix BR3459a]MDR6418044.1 hypothetical protein [Paraburkholderia phenoliruptrix]CAB4046715.1 hypothetical protein LMG9964_00346 [Paraburkholderia phenoliruptrix]
MRPIDSSLLLPGGRWSLHDLRRTRATYMQALGVMRIVIERYPNLLSSLEQADKQLNRQLMRHYHQYRYEREMRAVWQELGRSLRRPAGARYSNCRMPGYNAYDLGSEDAPAQPEAA